MSRTAKLVGHRFDRLRVIERMGSDPNGNALWLCVCDCGNEVAKSTNDFRRPTGQACRECAARSKANHRSHEQSRTPLHRVWIEMRSRCRSPSHKHFRLYGGRGIRVCDEWQDFESFRSWAIASGYEHRTHAPRGDRLSIDRINPDGNYEPANCRWITVRENAALARSKRDPKRGVFLRVVGEN